MRKFNARLDIINVTKLTLTTWNVTSNVVDNSGTYYATDVLVGDVVFHNGINNDTMESLICRYTVDSITSALGAALSIVLKWDEEDTSNPFEPNVGAEAFIAAPLTSYSSFLSSQSNNITELLSNTSRNIDIYYALKKLQGQMGGDTTLSVTKDITRYINISKDEYITFNDQYPCDNIFSDGQSFSFKAGDNMEITFPGDNAYSFIRVRLDLSQGTILSNDISASLVNGQGTAFDIVPVIVDNIQPTTHRPYAIGYLDFDIRGTSINIDNTFKIIFTKVCKVRAFEIYVENSNDYAVDYNLTNKVIVPTRDSDFASAPYTTIGGSGLDEGKLVVLNHIGKVDDTMLPDITPRQISTSTNLALGAVDYATHTGGSGAINPAIAVRYSNGQIFGGLSGHAELLTDASINYTTNYWTQTNVNDSVTISFDTVKVVTRIVMHSKPGEAILWDIYDDNNGDNLLLSGFGDGDIGVCNKVLTNSLAASMFCFRNYSGVFKTISKIELWHDGVSSSVAVLIKNPDGTYSSVMTTDASTNVGSGGKILLLNELGKINNSALPDSLNILKLSNANIAIGDNVISGTGSNAYSNIAIGNGALRNTYSAGNVAVGEGALCFNTSGYNNTAIGYQALMNNIAGGDFAYTNCSGLGCDSAASANNQVQLGNFNTTTYAYGAIQNRSDMRDKADITDTVLGLSFISALRPVDFKWDMRDYYFDTIEVEDPDNIVTQDNPNFDPTKEVSETNQQTITVPAKITKTVQVPKDGSRARSRKHHGLIAQEVKATMDEMGVDFAGFQDHSKIGGNDVLSIGYEELIAPIIKSIQELNVIIASQQKSIEDLKDLVEVQALAIHNLEDAVTK